MSKNNDALREIGLSKNEAKIYEILLREGEISVGTISTESGVHRRNVYDSLNRLMEKGLVFEITESKENRYQAIEPQRLVGLLDEKRELLDAVMPNLEALHDTLPNEYSLRTYRGIEGLKNYMRDILRVGEDVYFIGARGIWLDERIKNFLPYFMKEAKRKNIQFHHLFIHETKKECPEILKHVGTNYKFLPKNCSTPSSVDVFGDHVNILTDVGIGNAGDPIEYTVIKSKPVADSFRTWFRFMWDSLPEEK